MRVLKCMGGNFFSIRTYMRDLTHRICTYGEVHGFWKVRSAIKEEEGVFSVDILLVEDAEKVCNHLNLKLE